MFLGKGILKIYSKFTREHPCRSVISIKLLWRAASDHGTMFWQSISLLSANFPHLWRLTVTLGLRLNVYWRLFGLLHDARFIYRVIYLFVIAFACNAKSFAIAIIFFIFFFSTANLTDWRKLLVKFSTFIKLDKCGLIQTHWGMLCEKCVLQFRVWKHEMLQRK